jgi:outer membrane protein TolC
MRLAAASLVVILSTAVLAQDAEPAERPSVPAPEGPDKPVLRLRIQDVGRLALRNSPRFKASLLDPSIAETFEQEARGRFDPLFASRFEGGRDRSEVFFDPSRFGPGGSDPQFLKEDTLSGGADVSATQEWGGVWTLGFDAASTDRRGAESVQSLQPRYESLLSLGYSHPLLRGAGRDVNLSEEREAQSRTIQTESQVIREAEQTVLEAETLYWALCKSLADREVLRDSLKTANELLEISRARLDAGRGVPADVVEAEAGVARREGELITVETEIRNFSDRLRELVMPFDRPGADLEMTIHPVDLPIQDTSEVPQDPDREFLEQALMQRTDMRAAQAALAAAEQAELRARNQHEYELNALLNGGLRGLGSGFNDASDQWEDRDSYVWTAGLELAIPIGNITAAARLLRAERETMRAERDVAALRNVIIREVREAVRNVRSAAERIEAAEREREATEAQLAAERSRLEKGKARPFDVLEKEEDRSRAIARVIAAKVDFEIAGSELSSALGTLLQDREIEDLALGE